MTRFPMLQPDGKLAIWDTMMGEAAEVIYTKDGVTTGSLFYGGFVAFDCTFDEAATKVDGDSVEDRRRLCQEASSLEKRHWYMLVGDTIYWHGEDSDMVKSALARTPDRSLAMLFAGKIRLMLSVKRLTAKLESMQNNLEKIKARIEDRLTI